MSGTLQEPTCRNSVLGADSAAAEPLVVECSAAAIGAVVQTVAAVAADIAASDAAAAGSEVKRLHCESRQRLVASSGLWEPGSPKTPRQPFSSVLLPL